MKISARNILKGTVVDVIKGQTTSHVRLDIGGRIVTASITNEAVDDLQLKKGQTAYAVIKASDVMIVNRPIGCAWLPRKARRSGERGAPPPRSAERYEASLDRNECSPPDP